MNKITSICALTALTATGLLGCDTPASESDAKVESTGSALTVRRTHIDILAFGGADRGFTCANPGGSTFSGPVTLDICNIPWSLSGDNITTDVGPWGTRCLDVTNGRPQDGNVGLASCNGTINQRWRIRGGNIVSKNTSDGKEYCLDVTNGSHARGTRIGVAPCNGTSAQTFWVSATQAISSGYVNYDTGQCRAMCLDVLYDNEVAGATFDDFICNGSNAQIYDFWTDGTIHLTNNSNLCVTLGSTTQNGRRQVTLETCHYNVGFSSDPLQQWTMVHGANNSAYLTSNGFYLDVQNGSAAPSTPVGAFGFNGNTSQQWHPEPGVTRPSCGWNDTPPI